MAIYHLSVKTISRSAGRTATAAAAYRAGVKIEDEATGEIHDYTRKGGVESATLVLPQGAPKWASDRAQLWNKAEAAETRKNSTVAREFEIALPSELTREQRKALALEFASHLASEHRCAADVAIHAPGKEGDNRNHHAHILLTTRRLTAEGFTEKTRELDDRKTGPAKVKEWREYFALVQNRHLAEAGHDVRVDHRTLEEQGIDREPSIHLGPAATAIERRTGKASNVRQDHINSSVAVLIEKARLGRKLGQADEQISEIEQQLKDAKAEKAQEQAKEAAQKPTKRTAQETVESLPLEQQAKVWDTAIERTTKRLKKRLDQVSEKAMSRYQRRYSKFTDIAVNKPQAPTGLFAKFKEKAYQSELQVWRISANKAHKLEEQANKLVDQLDERTRGITAYVVGKMRDKFPKFAENVSNYKANLRAEKLKQEAAERDAKRDQNRGRDRGMSR